MIKAADIPAEQSLDPSSVLASEQRDEAWRAVLLSGRRRRETACDSGPWRKGGGREPGRRVGRRAGGQHHWGLPPRSRAEFTNNWLGRQRAMAAGSGPYAESRPHATVAFEDWLTE